MTPANVVLDDLQVAVAGSPATQNGPAPNDQRVGYVDVHRLLKIIRKWLPMLVAGVVLASAAAFLFSAMQQKTYEAKATLIVGQSLTSANPDYTGLLASQQLSATYASIATTRPLLAAVIDQMQLDLTTDELLRHISTETTTDSPLFVIAAQHTDPVAAAGIANLLADELITETATLRGRQADIQASINADLDATEAQIATTRDRLAEIVAIAERTPEDNAELATLEGRLVSLRATQATLLTYASAGATNLITVIEPAVVPDDPIAPRPLLNVLVAAILGLMLALGIALLAEYLSDSVEGAEDIDAIAGVGAIGTIGRIKASRGSQGPRELAALLYPRSASAEAYRTLRTNLEFTAVDAPVRSILVTSAKSGEGKSVTAANLAIVYAQTGRRVLLVDADLRKPRVHEAFGFGNAGGLTTVLIADRLEFEGVPHLTAQPNLSVLATGPQPPNPAELLSSQRMKLFMTSAVSAYDLVILDSPPLQGLADAAVLSTLVDRTLLVVDVKLSRRRALGQARDTLARAGANVVGVVLNRVSGLEYAEVADQYGAYLKPGATEPTPGEGVRQ